MDELIVQILSQLGVAGGTLYVLYRMNKDNNDLRSEETERRGKHNESTIKVLTEIKTEQTHIKDSNEKAIGKFDKGLRLQSEQIGQIQTHLDNQDVKIDKMGSSMESGINMISEMTQEMIDLHVKTEKRVDGIDGRVTNVEAEVADFKKKLGNNIQK